MATEISRKYFERKFTKMFFSGSNVFNQSFTKDSELCLSVPQKLPSLGKVVKAVFSWSNVGILENIEGKYNLKVFGFQGGGRDNGTTTMEDINDVTFSCDCLVVLDKDGRCTACKMGQDDTEDATCKSEIFKCIAAGDSHVIGMEENGKVYTLKRLLLELIPKEVDVGIPVKTVSCGKEHTLLRTGNGSVYSFGAGSRAQLGHGNLDVEPLMSPRLIESLEGIVITQVCAGGWHSAAVSDGGDLYMWGWNESGQVGFPSKSVEHSPGCDEISFLPTPSLLDINGEEIKKVACGSRHSATLTEHNNVYTWGWNAYGQLGLGDAQTRDQPTQVQCFKDGQLFVEDIFCGAWNTGFVTGNTEIT